jgi:hypothetical protein
MVNAAKDDSMEEMDIRVERREMSRESRGTV